LGPVLDPELLFKLFAHSKTTTCDNARGVLVVVLTKGCVEARLLRSIEVSCLTAPVIHGMLVASTVIPGFSGQLSLIQCAMSMLAASPVLGFT
jgi:hypothetical protein